MSIITSSGESIELDITDPEIVTHIEDEKVVLKLLCDKLTRKEFMINS